MAGHFLTIGKIINVRGLKGEMKVVSTTDFPEVRYKKGATVFLYDGKSDERIEFKITQVNNVKGHFFIKLNGINTIEEAELLISYLLQVPKKDSFLNKDSYYYDDLEQCKVYDESRTFIGTVRKVEAFSAQHTLLIERGPDQREVYVPFVDAFIKDVNIINKEVTIHVIEGLL